jgi:benzoylformate decarboxylase
MTVRQATYEVLRNLGINLVFGNPGSNELPFLKELPSDFRYVLALHERVAAGMALGYAMAKGEAAFVNLHSIASVGNGMSAIVDAYYCHAPLVITAGQQDRRQILAEPFLVSRAVEVARPYVKWAYEPSRAEDVPVAIARGYYLAMQPPRGPVFISIPMDDWNRSCHVTPVRRVSQLVLPNFKALDEIVEAINVSRKLALVVGSQIEEDRAWQEVVALAEHLAADVYEEPIPSRWSFPRTHFLFRGGLLPAQKPLAAQLAGYDTIVVLGSPVFLYYAYVPGDTVTPGTRLFQMTNSPTDAASALTGTSVVGDIGSAAEYIRIHSRKRSEIATERSPTAESAKGAADSPLTPDEVFSVLNTLLPPNAIIAEECPSSKGALDRHIFLDQPGSFYSVRSGILGFGMPLALGLQIAHPNRRVICIVGDGSAQYSIQALWTAVQQNLSIVFIILRNGDYSALKSFCDFTRVGRNAPGMEIPGIDVVHLARGYQMQAESVSKPEALEAALKRALVHNGPFMLSVDVTSDGLTCMGLDQTVNPPDYS